MAKITITYSESDEMVGDRVVSLTRTKDEFFLEDLMYFFSEASRVAGFTYVEKVGCETEGGKEWWSSF